MFSVRRAQDHLYTIKLKHRIEENLSTDIIGEFFVLRLRDMQFSTQIRSVLYQET